MCVDIYIFKPLKSEAIHETGLSGNVVASLFSSHNIYICMYVCMYVKTSERRISGLSLFSTGQVARHLVTALLNVGKLYLMSAICF